ncbi:hypothetical protein CVT24_003894 [Panaeolus cyanescens]|uniref:Uncharacterized protein n=1 Tax=Panaeolus cyanescens TaxID=181874 RepID=A0A409VV94_9AGAR|nr:hypothetical protein CVT24_003894 [Panaeolus cyanescens]
MPKAQSTVVLNPKKSNKRKNLTVTCSHKGCGFTAKTQKQVNAHERSIHKDETDEKANTPAAIKKHLRKSEAIAAPPEAALPFVLPGFVINSKSMPKIGAEAEVEPPHAPQKRKNVVNSARYSFHSQQHKYFNNDPSRLTAQKTVHTWNGKVFNHPLPVFSGIRDWDCMGLYISGHRDQGSEAAA